MIGLYPNIASRRDLPGCTSNSRKKIQDYSYSPSDQIGKGFSSIVYKGINDTTSNNYTCMDTLHAAYKPI